MSSNGTRMIQFGVFEVDLRTGELRRNGSRVKLQEQPLQTLTLLLEQPGEVVSREELRTRLWPADTFVDFDHSLNAAVRRLRDALGDSAENPRFVETVARRGYRFLAPVNGTPPIIEDEGSGWSAPARPYLVDRGGSGSLAVHRTGCGVVSGSARICSFVPTTSRRGASGDCQPRRISRH
jgi:DNA-binding winged helix-turn-helix (wHTH) protein